MPRPALRRRAGAVVATAALAATGALTAPGPASAAPDPGSPVKVNQVAYVPGAPKQATLVSSSTAPVAWTLKNASGATVASGQTTVKGPDALSGDSVHLIDFSTVDTAGSGYVLSAAGSNSYPFDISADPVKKLRYDALAFFYHQRSGTPIEAQYVGSQYARPAGHVNVAPNQGDNNVPCRTSCGYTLDVRGGWYDAGDQGKYVVNGGLSAWELLNSHERTLTVSGADRTALGDGKLAIPERANGVPDVLDEARWEVEFLLKMQVPAGRTDAGMVHHKIHDENWTGLPTRPEADSQRRLLSPVSTAATLNLAAVAAQASRLFKTYDPAFSSRALAAAERAYAAAKANPNRLASSSDATGGGAYEDSSVTDEFYWAAAELYATTGTAAYRTDVTGSSFYRGAAYNTRGWDWNWVAGLGDATLALVPNGLPPADISAIKAKIVSFADARLTEMSAQGYPAPLLAPTTYWGSTGTVANNANVLGLAFDFTGQAKYRNGVYQTLDYLLGRNPLNQSYIAGYGERAVRNVHHRFWANQLNGSLPIAPAGSVSGGPNSEIQDPVAQAQLAGCKPQKCYVDDIGAYSVNEVAINWNAAVAWLAAWAAEHAGSTPGPSPSQSVSVSPSASISPSASTSTSPSPSVSPSASTSPRPSPSVSTPIPDPVPVCRVAYSANSWSTGFGGSITLTNTGTSAWPGWTLAFSFPGNQKITQGWGGKWAQSGAAVTFSNESWNAGVPPNGSVTVGFNATYSGTNTNPATFTVNGIRCS